MVETRSTGPRNRDFCSRRHLPRSSFQKERGETQQPGFGEQILAVEACVHTPTRPSPRKKRRPVRGSDRGRVRRGSCLRYNSKSSAAIEDVAAIEGPARTQKVGDAVRDIPISLGSILPHKSRPMWARRDTQEVNRLQRKMYTRGIPLFSPPEEKTLSKAQTAKGPDLLTTYAQVVNDRAVALVIAKTMTTSPLHPLPQAELPTTMTTPPSTPLHPSKDHDDEHVHFPKQPQQSNGRTPSYKTSSHQIPCKLPKTTCLLRSMLKGEHMQKTASNTHGR